MQAGHPSWVDVVVYRDNKRQVHIMIESWGVPIREEELEAIFEHGRRGMYSEQGRGGGAGIGLHQVKKLAEVCGGNVYVTSRPARQNQSRYVGEHINTFNLFLPKTRV